MKAVITPEYGSPNVLQIREVAAPVIADDEILVEVHASPVTEGDRRLRSADFPGVSAVPGRLMMGVFRPRSSNQGSMFAGRVTAVGSKVERFSVGDDVFGSVDDGAYAEQLVVKASGTVAKMPTNCSYAEAADVPYGGVTALRFLRDMINVQPGEHVLIIGATGGVGRYAVQVAKRLGAEVTGVASAVGEQLARSLGADHFIDYRTEEWRTNGEQYDVIFDIAGATSWRAARRSLTTKGRYASVYLTLGLLIASILTAIEGGQKAKCGVAIGTQEDAVQLADWLGRGVIQATVGPKYMLDDIVAAHAAVETGSAEGTVMVVLSERLLLRQVA